MEISAGNTEPRYPEALPSASVMVDGYLWGGGCLTNNAKGHANPFQNPCQMSFPSERRHHDASSEDFNDRITYAQKEQKATSHLKEYNTQYNGLTIIPWEDFALSPTQINDLFHLEKTGFITYDPEEVNVFFHATRMNKPQLGEISENGGAWILTVENAHQLETIRLCLTERISVFGLTMIRNGTRLKNKQRAPCLLMVDPTDGTIGEQINAQIMRCSKIMEAQGKFCLEISFNGSVERWCRKITEEKCKSIGARLLITNGDEPETFGTLENILCCVACFPIWAIQTAIIKMHRKIAYEDILMEFSAEEVLLHGSVGGVQNQRRHLFREMPYSTVFYTKSNQNHTEDLGYKYVCLKKYDKNTSFSFTEKTHEKEQYETTSIYRCFEDKRTSLSHTTVSNSKSDEMILIDNNRANEYSTTPSNIAGQNHKNDTKDDLAVQRYEPLTQQPTLIKEKAKINENPCNEDVTEIESIAKLNTVQQKMSADEISQSEFDMSPASSFYQDQNTKTNEQIEIPIRKNLCNDDLEMKTDDENPIYFENSKMKCSSMSGDGTDVSSTAEQRNNEADMTISDLESDSLSDYETETSISTTSASSKQPFRHNMRLRKVTRYDSKRKYLSPHRPKLNIK
eukprot:XP_019922183.1 PREDICTED: uncharacterized protein LOC105326814 [Crassostrea gigas]